MRELRRVKFQDVISVGKFFQSKKELKDHKDRNHRIINSKVMRKKGTN
jgi:hypothetical protein